MWLRFRCVAGVCHSPLKQPTRYKCSCPSPRCSYVAKGGGQKEVVMQNFPAAAAAAAATGAGAGAGGGGGGVGGGGEGGGGGGAAAAASAAVELCYLVLEPVL